MDNKQWNEKIKKNFNDAAYRYLEYSNIQKFFAEKIVNFKGLRSEDPTRDLKIIGWGNIAKEMVDELKEGQNIVIEGRLKMNSFTKKDGTKEKQPELTASKIHQISPVDVIKSDQKEKNESFDNKENTKNSSWDSSPLVPEVDEIPF